MNGGHGAGGASTDSSTGAATAGARFVSWPVFAGSPAGLRAFNGHTGHGVPDIAGRIGGANDLVIFTEGNHFPVLLGGSVLDPFRDWAKADPRFADLVLDDIAVVTLPQPIIVAAMRHGGLKLGNAIIDISIKSGFYGDHRQHLRLLEGIAGHPRRAPAVPHHHCGTARSGRGLIRRCNIASTL